MGEVWKARDSRLNRNVAVKFADHRFSQRFEREARAIAALNHPNICTIYDVGPNYLVMELVDGLTLANRIARGPLPVPESIDIAKQIVNALECAHETGIVHRDLKPANIKIRPDGSVKVLDFGLAKANEDAEEDPDSPTMTMTSPGTIIGTPGYMPPEQIRGGAVDKRADIWAFGVVLYEMLSGQRPFEGRTSSDMLASVIKDEPDWTKLPPALCQLLRWCLEKDPKRRLRDIGDARRLLDECAQDQNALALAATASPRRIAGWAAAAVFGLIAAALAVIHFREKPAETPVSRLNILPPEGTTFPNAAWTPPAISADGRSIVFQAVSADGKYRLWLRPLDSMTPHPLPGTENGSYPFWSPDGKSLGFFADGKLKKIALAGGPPTALADAVEPRGGTWNQNGVIVFAPTAYSLERISATGGAPRSVTNTGLKTANRFPWFLPDGRHFAYLSGIAGGPYIIHIAMLDSPAEDRILDGAVDSQAVYAQGHLLFLRGNTLMSRAFDTGRLTFTGDALPVAEQIQVGYSVLALASFAVSQNGALAYQSGVNDVLLTWLDRTGKRLGTVGDAGILAQFSLSPDGKSVAVATHDSSVANIGIWLYDLARGLRTRFAGPGGAAVWSPDGKTVVFQSNRTGHVELYRKPADGSHDEELLYSDSLEKSASDFSPDGKYLAYTARSPDTGIDIWILQDPLGTPGGGGSRPFTRTQFNETGARFSPDGHWIAYHSNESSRNEVYVAPFPGPGGRVQVSTAGGAVPRWSANGKELFFLAPGGHLMAAQVDARPGSFAIKKVERLFGPLSGLGTSYDASADGQRFLTSLPPEGQTGGPMTLVLNWPGGLRKLP